MKTPLKIIFDDGSEEDFDECEILEYIDDDEIRSYAEWDLDMKSEDYFENDEKTIDDFENEEIIEELFFRYKIQKDIISISKLENFLNNYYL